MKARSYFGGKLGDDNCTRCLGLYGGLRGNENIIDGRVLCDYCHVEVMKGLEDIHCEYCSRSFADHRLMEIAQIETWNLSSNFIFCENKYPIRGSLVLMTVSNPKPDDPCDDDYMLEIST